jgi:hypothetical protein
MATGTPLELVLEMLDAVITDAEGLRRTARRVGSISQA